MNPNSRGPCAPAQHRQAQFVPIHRGSVHGTLGRWFWVIGEAHLGGGRTTNVALSARRPRRESDRVVGPLRPGNAGGGKGPDFWCAFEDGEVKVIGDEPGNT